MKTFCTILIALITSSVLAAPVKAGCHQDAVQVGPLCVDLYEASAWEITDDATLTALERGGITKPSDLAGVATQRGVTGNDYGSACPATGNGCNNLYAMSFASVLPARFITWFQAAAACRNIGKRLLTNAEWQTAALGTPDGAPCIVNTQAPRLAGTVGCVSDAGAFDMVGNLWEWVGDWVPAATSCPGWGLFVDDVNCLAGADTAASPAALIRGGDFVAGSGAGVFAVLGNVAPSAASAGYGFRCARLLSEPED